MKILTMRKGLVIVLSLSALILGIGVYAAVNNTIATGTMSFFEPFGGPATMRMRTLTIAPGEILGWHNHPGVGAYTIVKQGTLTLEDGCGGEQIYTAGHAFIETPGRVHRGKNLTHGEVITAQTFIVPGVNSTIFTIDTGQVCGRPISVNECRHDGWRNFNYPRTFNSENDCISSVIHGG